MALIKFGSAVTDGSGKLGGHVLQNSRGGAQLRTKPLPGPGCSPSQYFIRRINKQLQQGWQSLTDAQRLVWNNWPISQGLFNKSGDRHPLSGHDLWMKLQFSYLYAGFPLNPYVVPLRLSDAKEVEWMNHPVHRFETFISSGLKIISAINTIGYGFAATHPPFTVTVGQQIFVQLNYQKISGTVDYVVIGDWQKLTLISNQIVPFNGPGNYLFTINTASNFAAFAFRCGFPVNFKVDNCAVYKLL